MNSKCRSSHYFHRSMDNSNLVEDTMESVRNVIFRAISEILGKLKRPDEAEFIISSNTFLMVVA